MENQVLVCFESLPYEIDRITFQKNSLPPLHFHRRHTFLIPLILGLTMCLVWANLEPPPSYLPAALLSGGKSWFKNSPPAIGQPYRFTVGLEEPKRRKASSIGEASNSGCHYAFVRVFDAAVSCHSPSPVGLDHATSSALGTELGT